jgi:hypothetical protein
MGQKLLDDRHGRTFFFVGAASNAARRAASIIRSASF